MEALHGQAGFLELEVSHGRHSASDLTRIFSTMRVMSVRLFGLSSFHHFMAGREDGVNPMASSGFGSDEDEKMALDKEAERQDMNRSVHVHDTHHLMRLRKLFRAAEVEQQVGLEALVPVMVEAAQDTMDASEKCLDAIAHWFGETNKHRYFQQPTAEQYRAALDALRSAADELAISLDAFTNSNRLRLIEPYVRHFRSISPDGAHHLDAEGARAFRLGARPLFYCMVFCANLQNFAASVEKTTREVHALAEKRPSNKVWWPTGLRKLGKVLSNRKTNVGGALDFGQADGERELSGRNDSFVQDETEEGDGGEDGAETATANESHSKAGISADDDSHKAREKEKVRRRRVAAMDPDALGPTHWFHHFGRFLAAAYHFVWSPEGVFALKYAIVSFALWVPAVVPHSAYFNYQHRGLWALIMAQTGMATYAGEQLFSLAGRLIGTLAGCVVGMLVWYIGDAKSNGNAYGLAATMAVFFVPIVFLRREWERGP